MDLLYQLLQRIKEEANKRPNNYNPYDVASMRKGSKNITYDELANLIKETIEEDLRNKKFIQTNS